MLNWLESSKQEIELAIQVAKTIQLYVSDSYEQCLILDALAMVMATKAAEILEIKDIQRVTTAFEIVRKHPELLRVDLREAFPLSPHVLTTNVFSRIAYELSQTENSPIDTGVVNTPAILASDMVALAALCWLNEEITSIKDSGDSIAVIKASPKYDNLTITDRLHNATWYDPCVGSGVFPLAILAMSRALGLNIKTIANNIHGCDINPLFVTTTKIRAALYLFTSTSTTYREARQQSETCFFVANALDMYPERPSIYSKPLFPKVDIVIGNPPYVRADRLSRQLKLDLRRSYPSIFGGQVDLYVYFIAHGINALNKNGVLCYISPANFQRNLYGLNVRGFIEQTSKLMAVFDFDELPVFDNASLHSSVYAIKKTSQNTTTLSTLFKDLPSTHPLLAGLKQATSIPIANISKKGWYLNNTNTSEIFALLSQDVRPLLQHVGKIHSGIKTGYKNAFIIDEIQALEFLRDETTAPFIKPLLNPVDIRRWSPSWKHSYIIYIQKGEKISSETALYRHLKQFEYELRQRTDVKGHPTWYGLRECVYCEDFLRPKIVFPDIASYGRFALDAKGYFISDGAFAIPTEDYFLLGLLNSSLAGFYFRARCSSIGNPQNRGRLRYKKAYVQDFPIPCLVPVALKTDIEALTRSIVEGDFSLEKVQEIDNLIFDIYKIPANYRATFLSEHNYELS